MGDRPDSFMPLYIGDYLADTGHLNTTEHGAYLLLLFHYWKTGHALPADDARLAQIARMSLPDWNTVKVTVRVLFAETVTVTATDTVTVLTHSRVEKELAKAEAKYESRKAASARANEAKARKNHRHGDRSGVRDGYRDGSQPHFPKGKSGKGPRAPTGADTSPPAPKEVHPSWNGTRDVITRIVGEREFMAYLADAIFLPGPPCVIEAASEARAALIRNNCGPKLRGRFEAEIKVAS